jgi:oligopeptide/dipeptide ABC transporter ATP-binding protein
MSSEAISTTPVLEIKNLVVSFRSAGEMVYAVKGVNLKAYQGRNLGIAGESGCGKSVTAHSVLKLLPANSILESGEIIYTDRNLVPAHLERFSADGIQMRRIRGREIGMVFQDPMASLNPVYRIGDQLVEKVLENERVGKKEAEKRSAELLERLGLSHARDRMKRYPHEFSGGMKQRAMIAMAMITNPRILIADEPTTALDVTIQAQILDLMADVQKDSGVAIILITHNMGILTQMADDVAIMYMGRIVEYGTKEQIFRKPLHPYTKALMNCVPILSSKGKRLITIEGNTPDPREKISGCSFAPRCTSKSDRCFKECPQPYPTQDGRQVECFLYAASGGGPEAAS